MRDYIESPTNRNFSKNEQETWKKITYNYIKKTKKSKEGEEIELKKNAGLQAERAEFKNMCIYRLCNFRTTTIIKIF